jgi:hypothetical protein
MSSHPPSKTKKKTMAQFRAEKEQRAQDLELGVQLVEDVAKVLGHYEKETSSLKERLDAMTAFLDKANRAGELLQYHPNTYLRTLTCNLKARVHTHLGQHILALAAYRESGRVLHSATP